MSDAAGRGQGGRAYLVPRREKRKESALVACPKWPISSAKCSDACGCRASFCIPITCVRACVRV